MPSPHANRGGIHGEGHPAGLAPSHRSEVSGSDGQASRLTADHAIDSVAQPLT